MYYFFNLKMEHVYLSKCIRADASLTFHCEILRR